MARHVATNLLQIRACRGCFVHDSTFAHDQNAVSEGKHFVEIRADQEDSGARVASAQDARANFGDGRKIQPKARIRHDQ